MESTVKLFIYGLKASDGSKFKIHLPKECMGEKVKDLKLRLLRDRHLPIECQTLFLCKDRSQLELLKDDGEVPYLDQAGNTSTLHVYVTKSAQQKSLEKTRQSDFNDWLKKFKELNISPHYTEGPKKCGAAAPPVASPVVAARQNKPAKSVQIRPSSSDAGLMTRDEAIAPSPSPIPADVNSNNAQFVMKNYNSVADNCHLCSRANRQNAATHYCHSCDEYSCVMCTDCARDHPQHHDIEEMQRNVASPPPPNANVERNAAFPPNADVEFARILHQTMNPQVDTDGWKCETCTMINIMAHDICTVCETRRPGSEPEVIEVPAQDDRWQCTVCTLLNLPYRPSCSMCASERPPDYQIPPGYQPVEEELKFVDSGIASRIALDQDDEVYEEPIAGGGPISDED